MYVPAQRGERTEHCATCGCHEHDPIHDYVDPETLNQGGQKLEGAVETFFPYGKGGGFSEA